MKYIIDKNNNDLKLMYYNVNMVGLNVIPKNDVPGLSIKANKVVIIDKDLTDSYIKQRINKKIDKIIKFINIFIISFRKLNSNSYSFRWL